MIALIRKSLPVNRSSVSSFISLNSNDYYPKRSYLLICLVDVYLTQLRFQVP